MLPPVSLKPSSRSHADENRGGLRPQTEAWTARCPRGHPPGLLRCLGVPDSALVENIVLADCRPCSHPGGTCRSGETGDQHSLHSNMLYGRTASETLPPGSIETRSPLPDNTVSGIAPETPCAGPDCKMPISRLARPSSI